MGKRIVNKDKKEFFNTILQMRKMVAKHRGSYSADVMGLAKHCTKVPYTHLVGRRNTLKERHRHQKARAREESIQYDSSMKLLNSEVMEEKKEKDQFQKNKYKYQNLSQGKIGREKDGFLILSNKDIARINGKHQKSNHNQNKSKPHHQKEQKSHKKHNGKFKGKGKNTNKSF